MFFAETETTFKVIRAKLQSCGIKVYGKNEQNKPSKNVLGHLVPH
jgi:hypothetical protein